MADIFDFYVYDDRSIQFAIAEPIMLEDKDVTQFRFRIPKSLNGFDMSDWAWWFVYVNAKNEKYSIPLELTDDEDEPDNYSVATFSINYGITGSVGTIKFAIEVIDADTNGEILHEWHTRTYTTGVTNTLQGNQAEFAESEADIISALIVKVNNMRGSGAPDTVTLASQMTDTNKPYLYVGSESGYTKGNWYYWNGNAWASGGYFGSPAEIYVEGSALVINTILTDGNEVSY